jgi:LmbE family N-acetylglucosaminyl deacetylase
MTQHKQVYTPQGGPAPARAAYLAIAAHPDDIEIMAIDGILRSRREAGASFAGIVVADGSGSPRAGAFAAVSDKEMTRIRVEEQKAAARVGGYAAVWFLAYPSAEIRKGANQALVSELESLIRALKPEVVYTHHPADKHPTHAAVCLRVISALRRIEPENQPGQVIGCEVWRGLDWLPDQNKVLMDVSDEPELQKKLLEVYRSQIEGGKNYAEAAAGRRIANATFFESHATDRAKRLCFGMDLTPLLRDPALSPRDYLLTLTREFQNEALRQLETLE